MKKTAISTLILIVLTAFISGCSKKNIEQDSKGSISGKLVPTIAASSVAAVSVTGKVTTHATPDSSGHFNISGLQAGVYKIGFNTDTLFTPPDSLLVTVVAGQASDIGTVSFYVRSYIGLGSITGMVSPAEAVSGIVATAVSGTRKYSAIPDTSGNFRINAIIPGAYTVSFTPAPGYTVPGNVSVPVTAGQNSNMGSLVFLPTIYTRKAIDTISTPVTLNSTQAVDDFVKRAGMDSAIVLLGNLTITLPSVSVELADALNKILAVRYLAINNITNPSLTFKSLTELAWLYISNTANLTSVDLHAVKKFTAAPGLVSAISVSSCPALQNLNFNALSEFAGSISLYRTGFKDLSFFNKIQVKPFVVSIQYNQQLTTLRGLNLASDSISGCTITANPLLTTLDGLQGLKRMTGETTITANPVLQTLTGLDNIVYAYHFTLSANPQLNTVCPAKQVINFLKNAPDYTVLQMNPLGIYVKVTKQALMASGNGMYATRADLLAAIAKCP